MWTAVLLSLFLQESASTLYARGIELYNQGEIESAVQALSQAAALAPNVPDYRYHLGVAYLKLGKAREAARELEAAVGMMGMTRETRSREPKVLVQLAIAYLRLSNLPTARKRIELALKRGEDTADARYVLGLVESAEGDEAGAIVEFRAALEKDRDHIDANLELAKRLEVQGHLEEARGLLSRVSRALPSSFEIAMALGDLAFRAGDVLEAEKAFRAAHELRPADDRAAYNLGTVLLAREKFVEAIELLRPLSERETPHDAVLYNLAEAYRASGRLESARDLLQSLVAKEPPFQGAGFALGVTLDALGDLAGAERAYRRALEQRGDDLGSLMNLASVLERLGRIDEARGILEKALELPMEEDRARAIREAIQALVERID